MRRDVRGRRGGLGGAVEHRRPPRPRCTAGSAASCPRSPRGATWSWSARSSARRWPTPARRSPTSRAIAVTPGPGADRGAAGRRLGREGVRVRGRKPLIPVDHLHGHVASLFIAPGPARAAVPVPARLRRPHAAARRARPRPLDGAGPEPRRRRRRGLRQGRAPAGPRLPRRPGDRGGRRRRRSGGGRAAGGDGRAARASTSRSRVSRRLLRDARCATSGTIVADLAASYQAAIVASLVSRTAPSARADRRAAPRRGRRRGRERACCGRRWQRSASGAISSSGARRWRFAGTTRP